MSKTKVKLKSKSKTFGIPKFKSKFGEKLESKLNFDTKTTLTL